MPAAALTKLESGLKAALNDPATVKTIGQVRLLKDFMGSAELTKMLEGEQQALGPLVKERVAK